MVNLDSNGLYACYDYSNYPLQWRALAARRDPALARSADNVSAYHRIRYAIAGGQAGLAAIATGAKQPWLYVHGGPGGGLSPDDHMLVDPENFVPVMVVQRGAAGSGSEGSMQDVSVAHYLADYLDVLAEHGITRAHWAGGSWGTTLVLKLLLEHPQVFCKLPTLRGLWIPSTRDLEFGYSRLNTRFPNYQQEQQQFFGFIDEVQPFLERHGMWEQSRLSHPDSLPFVAFQFLINGDHGDVSMREEAARRIWRWELISAKSSPTEKDMAKIAASVADLPTALGFAATICHFAANRFFLNIGDDFESCEIWQRRDELKTLGLAQGDLVHGEADSLCRPEIARRWAMETGYRLHLIAGAGHSRSEPGIRDALIQVDNGLEKSPGNSAPGSATASEVSQENNPHSDTSVSAEFEKKVNLPSRKIVFTKKLPQPNLYGDLYTLEPSGVLTRITLGSDAHSGYDSAGGDFSPDGQYLVFDSDRNSHRHSDIYKVNLQDLDEVTRLTTTVDNEDASWNWVNDVLVFSSERNGSSGPFTMDADGSNQRELFPDNDNEIMFPRWNSLGDKIIFIEYYAGSDQRVCWADMNGLNKHDLTDQHRDNAPAFSPPLLPGTTEKVVFSRMEQASGSAGYKRDLFTINLDGTDLTQITEADAGTFYDFPVWSPDGAFVLYSKKVAQATSQLFELELSTGVETQITNDPVHDHHSPAYAP